MSVEAILEDVIETLSILAGAVELIFLVNREVPPQLIGDFGKLRQIITNLVGMISARENNKTKIVQETRLSLLQMGRLLYHVWCMNIERTAYCWSSRYTLKCILVLIAIKVMDTGVGIGLEQQKGLFTPFYQADSSSTRAHGGTGTFI